MYVIQGNYGNATIALMSWAHSRGLSEVVVTYVETGWAGVKWSVRVQEASACAERLGFEVVHLYSGLTFQALVKDRGEFPDQKFQWCAGLLKGVPLLSWLDERDPSGLATVLLGKRRDSRINHDLAEFIEESEHHGGRRVWFPLINESDESCDARVKSLGFAVLPHRSLECDPCVNCQAADFIRLEALDIEKTAQLEAEVGKSMFQVGSESKSVADMVVWAQSEPVLDKGSFSEAFDMGCGSPFGCGS